MRYRHSRPNRRRRIVVTQIHRCRSRHTMAKQVITLLTDDLDGGEADRTVEFGLDGVNYTIDLSEKNAGKLRKALDPFLGAATRVGRSGGVAPAARRAAASTRRASRDQKQAIRA